LTTDFEFDKDYAKSLEKFGVKIVPVNCVMRVGLFLYSPAIKSWLKFNIKNYDVVHMHSFRSYQNNIVMKYAVIFKVPYVVQPHGSTPYIGKLPLVMLKRIYDILWGNKIMKNAAKIIALNLSELKKIIVQFKNNNISNKIVIIPNGIDLSEYNELPPKRSFKKKYNIPEEKKILLYLGRIDKTKGINLLISAYAHLKNEMKCSDSILIIAGPDYGCLNNAKALANSLGVYNSVMFTGFISSEDKLMALVDADVFVSPSFYGFPMTFLEACAVGTPVVTTCLSDRLEWIDGNVGYVVQPKPRDLAEAINKIINDHELHRKLSKNCIEIVKSEYSVEKVVKILEKVNEEIVNGRANLRKCDR